jgi:hypothetical protein
MVIRHGRWLRLGWMQLGGLDSHLHASLLE